MIAALLVALLIVAIIASCQLIAIREAIEDSSYTACEDREALLHAMDRLNSEVSHMECLMDVAARSLELLYTHAVESEINRRNNT